LLEKYFYIEGLASNNMRLLLSGSEINHPDKEYDTTFNKLKSLVSKLNENPNDEDSLSKFKEITGLDYKQDSNVVKILNEGSLNDLKTVLPEVYNDSIISIINTAQGT
jgi:hypothetical protein